MAKFISGYLTCTELVYKALIKKESFPYDVKPRYKPLFLKAKSRYGKEISHYFIQFKDLIVEVIAISLLVIKLIGDY